MVIEVKSVIKIGQRRTQNKKINGRSLRNFSGERTERALRNDHEQTVGG